MIDEIHTTSNKRVVAICGSPRNMGSISLMNYVLDSSELDAVCLNKFKVYDMNLKMCDGCLLCEENGSCPHDDDMADVYSALNGSDVILLSTPVFFNSVPGMMKNFIDRMNPLCDSLKGKKFFLIVVGQLEGKDGEESRGLVVDYFRGLCEIFGMEFCDYVGLSSDSVDNHVQNNGEVLSKFKRELIDIVRKS